MKNKLMILLVIVFILSLGMTFFYIRQKKSTEDLSVINPIAGIIPTIETLPTPTIDPVQTQINTLKKDLEQIKTDLAKFKIEDKSLIPEKYIFDF